jgi:hypothetical protein
MEFVGKTVLKIPVLGWLIEDAIYGLPDAKYYFFGVVAVSLIMAVYEFGYPFVITLALTGTGICLFLIVHMTAADTFSKANRRALAAGKAERRKVAR